MHGYYLWNITNYVDSCSLKSKVKQRLMYWPNDYQGKKKKKPGVDEPEESDSYDEADDAISVPEDNEVLESLTEKVELQEKPKVKKTRRKIEPASPEPKETVTLRSHALEKSPADELVIIVLYA